MCNKQQKKTILQQLQLGLVPYIEPLNLFHLRNDSEMVKEMNLLCTSWQTAGKCKGTPGWSQMDPSTGPITRELGKKHSDHRDSVMKGLTRTSRFQHPQEMSRKIPEVPVRAEPLGSLSSGYQEQNSLGWASASSSPQKHSGPDNPPGTAKIKA